MPQYSWTDFLVCEHDLYGMALAGDTLKCPKCNRCYQVRNGVAKMIPSYEDELHQRYLASYEKIARDDLAQPLEGARDIRHDDLLSFIGDTSRKRVLDLGSSNAVYLEKMQADCKVALDISLPFLEAMDTSTDVFRVCGDAERLPFVPGFFDVVIISGLLEHILSPENLVARLHQICRGDTRIIVLVPWEEDLTPYKDLSWEFTHLRSFNSFTFSQLWYQFRIVKKKALWPRMSEPFIFHLDERLPTPIFDFLRYAYFHRGLAKKEADRRMMWYEQLPRRERRLLFAYRPTFYQFELRTYAGSWVPPAYDRLSRFAETVSRPFRRSR
ncbi:MAG TPA: methyltransferase domain-containing protein [Candidatus Dormibacteraeota bacterium]|nr:methyltransferase domain-containing protein [Candidatus Dormibacteraeota bacterium]